MRVITAAVFLTIGFMGQGQAAGPLSQLLGEPGACLYRFYDAAHLRNHGQQRVESIGLKYNDTYQDPGFDLTLELGFTLRNGQSYAAPALCSGSVCQLEGDGGQFSLSAVTDGMRLAIDPSRGVNVEGQSDFSGNLYDSDDRVFLIYPARPAACDW